MALAARQGFNHCQSESGWRLRLVRDWSPRLFTFGGSGPAEGNRLHAGRHSEHAPDGGSLRGVSFYNAKQARPSTRGTSTKPIRARGSAEMNRTRRQRKRAVEPTGVDAARHEVETAVTAVFCKGCTAGAAAGSGGRHCGLRRSDCRRSRANRHRRLARRSSASSRCPVRLSRGE